MTSAESGPFWVEAQKDGCTFRADIDVIIQEISDFPDSYPDTLELCPGEQVEIIVRELDSIELEGSIYLSGEKIIFSDPGDYTLTGYTGGCSTRKTITIMHVPDPSIDYSESLYWCEGTPLTLTLPIDSAGLTFSWSDGTSERERPITTTGEFPFDIQSGDCIFQSIYTVIRNDDAECESEECVVSIPNAVTPNGDGQNDGLEIFLTPACGNVESVTLWDKWGGLRYKTTAANLIPSVWKDLPVGIYIVQVVYKNEKGMRMTETGSVLVIQ